MLVVTLNHRNELVVTVPPELAGTPVVIRLGQITGPSDARIVIEAPRTIQVSRRPRAASEYRKQEGGPS